MTGMVILTGLMQYCNIWKAILRGFSGNRDYVAGNVDIFMECSYDARVSIIQRGKMRGVTLLEANQNMSPHCRNKRLIRYNGKGRTA